MNLGLKKILKADQTRFDDRQTICNLSLTSIELMEQAATAFVNALDLNSMKGKKVLIVCGVGNNGGDGFAITRLLKLKSIKCKAVLIKFRDFLSIECEINMNCLEDVLIAESNNETPDFETYDVIIDAILGSGLKQPANGFIGDVINGINDANKVVYSVDVPSGLMTDSFVSSQSIIKSDLTITFQRPKLSFFQMESNAYVRSWKVVDIGLDENVIQSLESDNFLLDRAISNVILPRNKASHKGNYGHALLVVGSYGKMGAANLSARACLRSGVGLLTMHIPKCGYDIAQISVPEAMCSVDENNRCIQTVPDLSKYQCVGVGPGIGTEQITVEALQLVLQNFESPIVLDADALNILSGNPSLLKNIPSDSILTPHPKEFERLVGPWKNSSECLSKQKEFSRVNDCILVLKGTNTCIVNQDGQVFYNTSGNPGMATAGSGDVLTGIITGLLTQRYVPLHAALLGVYFHGLAGDVAVQDKGENALLASDIIDKLRIDRT